MDPITVSIYVPQTEAIRRGATMAGRSVLTVDPSGWGQELRDRLAHDLSPGQSQNPIVVSEPTEAALIAVLEAEIAEDQRRAAEQAAELEKRVREYLAAPLTGWPWFTAQDCITVRVRGGHSAFGNQIPSDPRLDDLYAQAQGIARANRQRRDEEAAQRKARREEEERAREEAEAAKARRDEAELDAFVQRFGSPNQRERFDAGMLPKYELRKLLLDSVLTPQLGQRPLYEPLTGASFEHHEGCCGGYSYSSDAATEATADQWERFQQIRELVVTSPFSPTAVELIEHFGRCECGAVAHRWGVRVTITLGGLECRREFAVTGKEE